MSDKPKLEKTTLVFSQDGDSCQEESDTSQEIIIETENAGAGNFYVISTNRWTFEKIEDLVKLIKKIKVVQ